MAIPLTTNQQTVSSLYLSYYGRPADVAGLAYWTGVLARIDGHVRSIADAFANSQESVNRFGEMTTAQHIANVYQQLLGRNPEPAGADYWLGEVTAGRTTMAQLAINIHGGALGRDATTVDARQQVANQFTAALPANGVGYVGAAAADVGRLIIQATTSTISNAGITALVNAGTTLAASATSNPAVFTALTGTNGQLTDLLLTPTGAANPLALVNLVSTIVTTAAGNAASLTTLLRTGTLTDAVTKLPPGVTLTGLDTAITEGGLAGGAGMLYPINPGSGDTGSGDTGGGDTTPPTVTSVTVPANATYKVGDVLSFTVNTSENVVVTGTPQLALTIGSAAVQAAYASGTGTNALVFSYTVQAADADADGIAVSTLGLNSGTLKDAAGNNMILTLNSVGTTTAVKVDGVIPTVTNTSSAYDEGSNTLALTGTDYATLLETGEDATTDIKGRLDWSKLVWDINGDNGTTTDVTFAEGDITSAKVTNGTTLTIVLAGAKGTALESTTGYGATGTADTIDIATGFAKDLAGNAATTDAMADGVNTITAVAVATAPTVTSVTVPVDKTYKVGDILSFTVNTSESINVVTTDGTPQLALTIGSATVQAAYASGTGTNALVFSYTVQAADADADGIAVSTLGLNSGTLKDAAGNNMILTLNSVGATSAVKVDGVIPTVTNTSSAYDEGSNTLTLTGTDYATLLETGEDATTDIKGRLDWSKLVWDINGDNGTTTDVTFAEGDITSAKVTNGTTLTIVLAGAKGTALEGTTGYGASGNFDTIDITAGFAVDLSGNVATTDVLNNGAIAIDGPPIMGDIPNQQLLVGSSFSLNLTHYVTLTNGPLVAISIDTGSLPTGLSLNPATGVVTGTPDVSGTYNVSFRAHDDDGSSNLDFVSFTVTLDATAPTITTGPTIASATTISLTSDEAGTAGLYTGATLVGSKATMVAATPNTITVAAQTTLVTTSLIVDDAAGNATTSASKILLGTTGVDSISATTATDILFGFEGADVFTLVAGANPTAGLVQIGDYATNTTGESIVFGGAAAAWATDVITWNINNGIATKAGATENDFYADFVAATGAAGEVIAFEYNGNTYLFGEGVDTNDTNNTAVVLVGLTGITAVATTGGANTVLIA